MKIGPHVLLLFILPLFGRCWWDVGHMVAAAIAEHHLREMSPHSYVAFKEIVESINFLADEKSQTLIESASWPDDLRSAKYSMNLWDAWHYIDSPFIADGSFPQINSTEATLNAVNSLNQAHRVLSSNKMMKTAERALFARYLIHMVGDIHQPLHGVALYNQSFPKGDAGGNFIKITLLNGTGNYNLHKFWDSGALRVQNDSFTFNRPLSLDSMTKLKNYAKGFMDEYGDRVEEASKNLDPQAWALESLNLAKNVVYPHLF